MTNGDPIGTRGRLSNLLRGDGLKARALRGSALTLLQFGGENLLRLVSNLILTRLLFPEAFGLMALVMVVLVGVAMFSDIGTTSAIIQHKRGEEPDFLNTAWTMQVLRGIFLWLVICAIASPMAAFYEEPQLAAMLPVAGMTALIDGLRSTRIDVLNRRLQLGRITAVNLTAQVFGLTVLSLLAWQMQSVWALVIGQLFSSALGTVLSYVAYPGTPNRFRIEREAFKSLFRYGKYIFLATLAGFLINQGDRAILGKFISLSELGLYNIAFFLATVPGILGNAVSNKVLFPLYVQRPPSEGAENRGKIARARRMVSVTLFGLAACLGISGVWLIEFLYDPRYHAAGAILVLLVAAATPQMVIQSYPALLLSAGDSRRFALLVVIRAVVNTLLMLWAIPQYGVGGVALAMFASALITYPSIVWMARHYQGWDPRHDALFFAVSAILVSVLLWLHPEAILGSFAV